MRRQATYDTAAEVAEGFHDHRSDATVDSPGTDGPDAEAVTADARQRLSGLDWLRAIRDGACVQPSATRGAGYVLSEVDHGRACATLEPDFRHRGLLDDVHTGVIAALLEIAARCAVQTTLPPGHACKTVEFKVHYVRTLPHAIPRISAIGEVQRAGRQRVMADARLVDEAGTVFAMASATCLFFLLLPPA